MQRRSILLAAPTILIAKSFSHPVGLNLYTVRTALEKDAAGTYAALGKIGIVPIEVRPVHLNQHAAMIQSAGLKPVHMFVESAVITGAWDEWAEYGKAIAAKRKMPPPSANAPRARLEDMIELAIKHGVKRIGTSMLIGQERTGAGIDAMNRASETIGKAGLELYYHNHAFEFDGEAGSRFIDKLHKQLNPKVRLELDVFWASVTGNSPITLLEAWKGRVKSVHLKDMAPDAARPKVESDVPPTAFRELGKGKLDLKAILNAAEKAGVEHYLIELDYSPGDPLESVKNCYHYLKQISL